MEFITFISVVMLLVFVIGLSGRVRKLEQIIKGGVVGQTPEPSYQAASPQPEVQQPTLQTNQPFVPIQTGPTAVDRFVGWLREEWLLKLGAMLLIIGFGWLTTYAFLNDWIGPMGRISLGIVAGAIFILLGWWRIRKYIHQGGVFLVLGSTTILLTIFAAREIYGFFTPLSALTVMFLSTAFVALASVKYKNRGLALASLILAGVAPLLTNAPSPDYIALYAYLFVVTLGAVWVVVLTGRRELTIAALMMIAFYSFPHLSSFVSSDRETLLLFVYAFAGLFFLTNTAGILKLKGREIIPDLVTAAGNGLFLLIWIMVAAQDEWKSLIIAVWMAVFIVGSFLIFKITQRRASFYVYAGVGVAMLAAATSAELSGAALTIAYTIESGMISLISYAVLRDIKIAEKTSLLLLGPVILSFGNITSRAWATSVINKDFFVLLLLSIIFLWLGMIFLRPAKESGSGESQKLNSILLVAGSAYAYILLWLSLRAGLENDDTAVMISLVIYIVIGLITYLYGLTKEKRGLRLYGGTLIGLVVARLLLVDVWNMELAGRITTFFLIGTLLVSTAFLGKKKQVKITPDNL